jgi:hypothetical protein
MELNMIPMTAQNASGFAMPTCGHVSVARTDAFGTTTVVRERRAAVITDVKGDMGLAAYVPGTRAWSPPIS